PTKCEQWHLQSIACGQECAVVDGVLIECCELGKAGMHGSWKGVELRIVLPRRFAEAIRRSREFVPESIQVDALAPCHQPLHVGPSEAKVPEQGILQDLFPGPDARHR